MSKRNPDAPNQIVLFQELLCEKIEHKPHAARFFSYLADELNLTYYAQLPMGAPLYSRRVLTAVIFYAMYNGHYASQKICKFAEDSIGAQWILSGMSMPSYKTVERTIDSLLDELDRLFFQIIGICEGLSLIGRERMYIDGTKVKANASKHKAMSYDHLMKNIKSQTNDMEALYETIKPYIDEAEQMSDDELKTCIHEQAQQVNQILRKQHQKELQDKEQQVFNLDFEETEKKQGLDEERLKSSSPLLNNVEAESFEETVDVLNNIAFTYDRICNMEEATKKLEEQWLKEHGNKKIPLDKQINFTDADSSIMVTKHQGVQQCYNHFAWVDAKAHIILGAHTSNNASDQLGLKPTMEHAESMCGSLKGIIAGGDAGFFSANNIAYMEEEKGTDFYASYPKAKHKFAKDKFVYDAQSDTYTCPEGHTLRHQKTKKSGTVREYSNKEACLSCPLSAECTKANDGIRKIDRDMENDRIREEAKIKADSEMGKEILRQRKSVPEPVWGNIQTQDGWKQSHKRGMNNASREFKLRCVMHNIRKIIKVYLNSSSYQETVHSKEILYKDTA